MCLCLHVVYIACASYVYVWHMYLCVPLGGLPVSLSLYMCSTYLCGFLCVLVSLCTVWYGLILMEALSKCVPVHLCVCVCVVHAFLCMCALIEV